MGYYHKDLRIYQPHHHVRGAGKMANRAVLKAASRIYQIIEEINRRFVEQIQTYPGNEEKVKNGHHYDGQVKMAHLAIVAGYSVNGVARLHTEILKEPGAEGFLPDDAGEVQQ